MNDTVFIYVLKDPLLGDIRYVGKAKNPKVRYLKHLKVREKTHKSNWIRYLLSKGLKPELEVVDEVPDSEWPSWEAAYIQFFKESGQPLVNGTNGGEGVSGHVHSERTREKIRASHLGKLRGTYSPEHRRHISEALSGRELSEAHRKSLSISHAGKIFSFETRQKMSVKQTGKTLSAEHRAKIGASNKMSRENKLKEKLCPT